MVNWGEERGEGVWCCFWKYFTVPGWSGLLGLLVVALAVLLFLEVSPLSLAGGVVAFPLPWPF